MVRWVTRPSERVSEPRLVSKSHDVLDLPEKAAGVSMVVVAERDELDAVARSQVLRNVGEEPRLPVPVAVGNGEW
jgi:hypothetical protein